jgi:MFS family permease
VVGALGMARDLRLFYVFRLLATSYLWVPISMAFMASRGLGFDQIMMLSALYSGVVIAVEIPTGALADRMGRRVTMMAGALAMVASCLVAYHAHSFAVFAVAEALAAISISLCSGADSAYLFDLLAARGKVEEYPHRESVASAWHLFGNAAAYAAGGVLGEVGLGLPYLVTAAIAALACVAALGLGPEGAPRPRTSARSELTAYLSTMRGAVDDVVRSRRLIWVMGFSALVFVLIKVTNYLYQPYLDGRGYGLAATGFVFAGVYLLASFVAHRGKPIRDRLGEAPLVWGVLIALAGSFLLLDQLAGPWVLGALAIQAVAKGLYSPLTKPMLNREIRDSSRRATVLSIESIGRRAAMAAFSLLAGLFAAGSAIVLCGVVGFIGLAILALTSRHSPVRRHRLGSLGDAAASPPPAAAPLPNPASMSPVPVPAELSIDK